MLKFYIPHSTKDEKIVMLLRRHWSVLFLKLLFWLIAAILPVIFYVVDPTALDSVFDHAVLQPLFVLLASIYYLYVWLFMLFSFVDYYLDAWIVTTRRIVNIEQAGLFSRKVAEQKLFRIQDITSEMKGMLPTFLNYGTVHVQTAGEQAHFVFKQVPNPAQVAQAVIKMVEENKKYHQIEEEDGEQPTK